MLVITRKQGERLRLTMPDGMVVWVKVVEVDRGHVRVGIEAPRGVAVDREEIIDRDQRA